MNAAAGSFQPSPRERTGPDPLERIETLFYCIGAQKAATTWLAGHMKSDENIHLTQKEVHYWDTIRSPYKKWDRMGLERGVSRKSDLFDPVESADQRNSEQSKGRKPLREEMFVGSPFDHTAYCERLVHGISDQKVVGDLTPSYALCRQSTFAEMYSLHRNARFLFIMRDPVRRLWSGLKHRYKFFLTSGEITIGDFRDLFRIAVEDASNVDYRRSNYIETIHNLDAAIPGSRVMYSFFETFISQSSVDRVYEFIGIEGAPPVSTGVIHPSAKAEWRLDAELYALGREAFSETYDYVQKRFGDDVPPQWGIFVAPNSEKSEPLQ